MKKDEFPYNIKPRDEWEEKNKMWNILAVEGTLECEMICDKCEWERYCEWYQMKEDFYKQKGEDI